MSDLLEDLDWEIKSFVDSYASEVAGASVELLMAGEIDEVQHSNNMQDAFKAAGTMTPQGSGSSLLSHEELSRNEIFFTITGSGQLKTYQGRQPDNPSLRGSEAIIGVNKGTGDIRVAGGSVDALARNEANVRYNLELEGFLVPVQDVVAASIRRDQVDDVIRQAKTRVKEGIKQGQIRAAKIREGSVPVGAQVYGRSSDINNDPLLQLKFDLGVVERTFPPILVTRKLADAKSRALGYTDDIYNILDGHNRHEAYKRAGMETPAIIIDIVEEAIPAAAAEVAKVVAKVRFSTKALDARGVSTIVEPAGGGNLRLTGDAAYDIQLKLYDLLGPAEAQIVAETADIEQRVVRIETLQRVIKAAKKATES